MQKSEIRKGQHVIYGASGICLIDDIKEISFYSGDTGKMYCILHPLKNKESAIYLPLDNKKLIAKIRPLLTKKEIDDLLMGIADQIPEWENDRRRRAEIFNETLANGHTRELLLMIRCIYLKRSELLHKNKNLAVSDSNVLKAAEVLVEDEFSHVLNIQKDDVGEYIRNKLNIFPALQKSHT